jgi:hypothetical protein
LELLELLAGRNHLVPGPRHFQYLAANRDGRNHQDDHDWAQVGQGTFDWLAQGSERVGLQRSLLADRNEQYVLNEESIP